MPAHDRRGGAERFSKRILSRLKEIHGMGLSSGSQPRQFVAEADVQACLARLAEVIKNPYGRSVMAHAFGEMGWYQVACPSNEVKEMWELALRSDQEEARFSDPDQITPRARFDEFIAKAVKRVNEKEERYARERCTFVDSDTGEQCKRLGHYGDPYACFTHRSKLCPISRP